ncbi:sugar ABC transporter permease [Streptomyces antimycoticus]|uniref:Sugar ABC transporter permease n=1 Tax=Streptomyces antimycoticus TaxID=68175 RepID=A0A499V208_9ACTN|nr:sugar ABC transporter permease [Streptomyces antimycoticus]
MRRSVLDRKPAGQRLRLPYLLLVPSFVFMVLLLGWPTVVGIREAFMGPDGFTLANWERMAAEPRFWEAVRNTLLLIVVVIPIQFVLAFGMALLLQSRLRGSRLYFYLWAVPLAVSDLAAGLVWLSIFTDRGYLNSVLAALGLGDGFSWLSYQHHSTMLLAVVLAEIWRSTSLVLIIVVAGMQMIPREYDEAAQVFGGGAWQRVRHVILPLVKPNLQVALILRMIMAMQSFAVAQALTGRNFPLLVGETYEWFAALQNPAVASAVALVVLGVSLVASITCLRVLRQPEAEVRLR